VRCFGDGDELLGRYHDGEWGRPILDEHGLFERLCLEGMQSGLSWTLILKRRESLRSAFAGFDPEAVARFGQRDVERLLGDPGVIRHRGKIEAVVANAQATLALRERGTPLHELVWSYRPAPRPAIETYEGLDNPPEAGALAKELKRAGFRFVGPTTVYAAMQAAGLVNDHLAGCPVWTEVDRAQRSTEPPHPNNPK
jgi:DNA-3-methyladenine glycosylase I